MQQWSYATSVFTNVSLVFCILVNYSIVQSFQSITFFYFSNVHWFFQKSPFQFVIPPASWNPLANYMFDLFLVMSCLGRGSSNYPYWHLFLDNSPSRSELLINICSNDHKLHLFSPGLWNVSFVLCIYVDFLIVQ